MCFLTNEKKKELSKTARQIVENGKGILAADESVGTVAKRFSSINLQNTEENRMRYRELMFGADKSFSNYIGGIILHDETFFQKNKQNVLFPESINNLGIKVGIKVDKGVVELPTGETTTQGLDGLNERCAAYYEKGARFAKWRATLKISNTTPTQLAVVENATVLARYASICQKNGLVPIVEPEILMDGDHTLEKAAFIAENVLSNVYRKLNEYHVFLEGTLLKPNMICPGINCKENYSVRQIAEATVRVLRRTVPPAVPGITFLSGGQSEVAAMLHLNEINRIPLQKPWRLTFSFARALQGSVLLVWKGKDENTEEARKVFLQRCISNSQASLGKCENKEGMEESMFINDYSY